MAKTGIILRLTYADAEILRRTCIEYANILSNSGRVDDMTTEARIEVLKSASRLHVMASMLEAATR